VIHSGKTHVAVAWAAMIAFALMVGAGSCAAAEHSGAASEPPHPAAFGEPTLLGYLENGGITEASGMAASRRHSGVLWIVNDGGNEPAVYAVNMQGAHLGRVRVRNAQNADWEDLAAFRLDNTATLLIADFGDNHARREEYHLYIVREPDIAEYSDRQEFSVDWQRRVRFVYEDGPRDCEAVAVDPENNQILLLTKRTVPAVLYSLPLRAEKQPPVLVARRVAEIKHLRPPEGAPAVFDPRFEKLRSQPTAMDISPDGSEVAILTYGDGYLYRRPAYAGGANAFRNPPQWIRMPTLRQAESLCFSADGQSLFVTSERVPAPLYRLDRRLPLQRRITP
jgi:hypothetical protein